MGWIYRNKILDSSFCFNMNILYNTDKFYIMDNHLAAAWCWIQKINPNIRYGLLHIDRHYDLLNCKSEKAIELNRSKLIGDDFSDYLNSKDCNEEFPIVKYDNYIELFGYLFPNVIRKAFFVTHKDGNDNNETTYINVKEEDVFKYSLSEIPYLSINNKDVEKWIVNIDIDFFFQNNLENEYFQIFTKKYVKQLCINIKELLPQIEVVTIALSPEFCGGWGNAFNVLKTINEVFNIEFPFRYKRSKGVSLLK